MKFRNVVYLLIKDYWKNIQGGKYISLAPLSGEENRFKALIHLKEYAYERNISGAASVYKKIANKALSQAGTWSSDDAENHIWKIFHEECLSRGIKPNVRVNPLRPSAGDKKSLFAFARNIPRHESVAVWAFKMISEGKLEEAHTAIKSVWGIGDKIASFYLRDIFWLGHGLNPQVTVKADYLLQPIDIWVERAGAALGHSGKTKVSLARFFSSLEKENKIAHGGANIGCWMLGSNYIRDPVKFDHVFKAMVGQSSDPSIVLSIADQFENFFGKFGSMLKDIIQQNAAAHDKNK
jgi:hypothetical protein